jgi:tetratricopeptide (TPR) repeat protein
LDTLSADRKALLQHASVLGKVFWLGGVASMSGTDERAVREALHELANKELVRAIRSTSVEGQAEYSFWHALVRDVAYGQIPRAQRAEKHLAAAAWIEGIAGDRAADHAEFLAHHYEVALDLAAASGVKRDDTVRLNAIRFLAMAAERASTLDLPSALAFHRRVEALSQDGDPDLPVRRVKMLETAFELGEAGSAEMEDAYEEGVAYLRSNGDVLAAGDMLVKFAKFLSNVGRTADGERVRDEAYALLEPLGPTEQLALATSTVAGSHMLAGRFPEWNEWTERALSLADQLDLVDVEARTLEYRGIYRIITGQEGGRADLERALELFLQLGLGNETAVAYDNLADWICYTDGPLPGLAVYEEGIRFAERRGLGFIGVWMQAEITWRLFDVGRWDDVISISEQIRGWGRGVSTPHVMAATTEAKVRTYRGDLDRAAAIMTEMLPMAREIQDIQTLWPAILAAALIALEQGDRSTVTSLLDELEGNMSTSPYDRGFGAPEGVTLSLAIGDMARAERLAGTGETGLPRYRAARLAMLAARARVDTARGRHEEALQLFGSLADDWAQSEEIFARAQALLGSARSLVALGREEEAALAAAEAGQVFTDLRARSLAQEAADLSGAVAAQES